MPTYLYALDGEGAERLEIVVTGLWNAATVLLDGTQIGAIPNHAALQKGQDFPLPDGSTLNVQLVSKFAMPSQLQVLRNGRPLLSSRFTSPGRLKAAYSLVYLIAVFNLVFGLVSFISVRNILGQTGSGWGYIIYGLGFLVLGFFIQRKSVIAMTLALIVFAIDSVVGLFLSISQGAPLNILGLTMRGFFLVGMIQGIKAINDLKQRND